MARHGNVFLLAAFFWTAAVSAHADALPDPEPATPTGTYSLTPMPAGTTCTVVVVPAPLAGPNGPWLGFVFINGELVQQETFSIWRAPAGGGYRWGNTKVGPTTGLPGAGTLKWDNDHYESEVTQGDNTGTRRTWTPQ
jgi:hypothetical protein